MAYKHTLHVPITITSTHANWKDVAIEDIAGKLQKALQNLPKLQKSLIHQSTGKASIIDYLKTL